MLIDRRKLVDYALSPAHPTGRHKARVFAAALGLGLADAPVLESWLRAAARDSHAALRGAADRHGERWLISFNVTRDSHIATLVSAWIVPADGGRTRLVTVYVA